MPRASAHSRSAESSGIVQQAAARSSAPEPQPKSFASAPSSRPIDARHPGESRRQRRAICSTGGSASSPATRDPFEASRTPSKRHGLYGWELTQYNQNRGKPINREFKIITFRETTRYLDPSSLSPTKTSKFPLWPDLISEPLQAILEHRIFSLKNVIKANFHVSL